MRRKDRREVIMIDFGRYFLHEHQIFLDNINYEVLKLEKAGPVIRCHDTALLLTEVKPEGSSSMDGGAFLRGRPLAPMSDVLFS